MEEKIKIIDNSGDRDFFTIVPNYILNHSTANDQSLYLQMKRYAGEDGKCFATQETLKSKTGMGRQSLLKSLNYLIKHKWVEYVGMTGGKTRPIKTYKINNIWQKNNDYYKENQEIVSETAVSFNQEIVSETARDSVQNSTKIVSETAIEEEPVSRRTNKEEPTLATPSVADEPIKEYLNKFSTINPSYEQLFSNKTQRAAMDRLLKKHGAEKIDKLLEILPKSNQQDFAPVCTTPLQLEQKLAALLLFLNKQNKKGIQSL